MNIEGKKVFITGGSAGIGKAIIAQLAKHKVTHVAVMGRTKSTLQALKDDFPAINFLLLQGDVSKPSDITNATQKIEAQWGALDVLINNAGVVTAGLLEDIDDADIASIVNVNLTGLILLTKHLLPLLKRSDEGAIINLSSGLGYVAMPYYTVYAATKAGVKHFSEGLRRELEQFPLHVMTVSPTATDTGMMKTAKAGAMDSPQKVAEATLNGLKNNEIEVILGDENYRQLIDLNKTKPQQADQKLEGSVDAMADRAENHRSM